MRYDRSASYIRKFRANPKHRTVASDYAKYGLAVEQPLLVKREIMKSQRHEYHHDLSTQA